MELEFSDEQGAVQLDQTTVTFLELSNIIECSDNNRQTDRQAYIGGFHLQ